jgi:hypothetical protein
MDKRVAGTVRAACERLGTTPRERARGVSELHEFVADETSEVVSPGAERKSIPFRLMGMTSVAPTYQFARRGLRTTWVSHRLVLVTAAVILLVAGFVLATRLGTTASQPVRLDPMPTSPGAGV